MDDRVVILAIMHGAPSHQLADHALAHPSPAYSFVYDWCSRRWLRETLSSGPRQPGRSVESLRLSLV